LSQIDARNNRIGRANIVSAIYDTALVPAQVAASYEVGPDPCCRRRPGAHARKVGDAPGLASWMVLTYGTHVILHPGTRCARLVVAARMLQ